MRSVLGVPSFRASAVSLVLGLGWATVPLPVTAGQTQEVCGAAALQAAVARGGTIHFGCDGTIVLTGTLVVNQDTVLNAAGHRVVLSGGDSVRLFEVRSNAHLTLLNLELTRGRSTNSPGGSRADIEGWGGAVFVDGGTLSASNCLFSENLATSLKGGDGAAQGGAIHVRAGTLELQDCRFSSNRVDGWQGLRPTLTPGKPAQGGSARGAAIYQGAGTLRALRTHFDGNVAKGGSLEGIGTFGAAYGGALFAGATNAPMTVLLQDCSFTSNTADAGTASRNSSILPAGGGALHLGSPTTHATILGCEFGTNVCLGGWGWNEGSPGSGGAIGNVGKLTCRHSRFNANRAVGGISMVSRHHGSGGAVWSMGSLIVQECSFQNNSALGHTGQGQAGSPRGADGSDGLGGALYLGGPAQISGSSFAHNRAAGGAGADIPGQYLTSGGNGYGGAVYATGPTTMVNCTLFQNSAIGGDANSVFGLSPGQAAAGGIYLASGVHAGTNLTLVENVALTNRLGAGASGGAIVVASAARGSLVNSLVAGLSAGGNCQGTFQESRGNLGSDSSCHFAGAGGRDNVAPGTGAFGDHGGPTPTVALLAGSPAIDTGATSACPETDQRGLTRNGAVGTGCDVGAFEVGPKGSLVVLPAPGGLGRVVLYSDLPDAPQTFELSTDLAVWTPVSTNRTDAAGMLLMPWPPPPSDPSSTAWFLRGRRNE